VERIYAADVEPPGDETSPVEVARFFEVTRADMNSALMARADGQRREVSLTRTGLRLSDADRAHLVAEFERLILEAQRKSDLEGTWTRVVWTRKTGDRRGQRTRRGHVTGGQLWPFARNAPVRSKGKRGP
jgi:hypothetical protein